MSTSTTNLGLTKPSGNERPDVDIINANMDTIDAAIGAVGNVSLQSQITSLQESVSSKKTLLARSRTDVTISFDWIKIDTWWFLCIYVNDDMKIKIADGTGMPT